jgi:hypothetical protein
MSGNYIQFIRVIDRTCGPVEIVWETHFVEEATSYFRVELSVVLTSVYPEIEGIDGFGVGGEESGGDEDEGGIGGY